MKTENELKQLLKEFGYLKTGELNNTLALLTDADLIYLIQYHNGSDISGSKSNFLRLKMYNEIFVRNNIGRSQTNHLSFKQRSFLESLNLLPVPKTDLLAGFDRVDRLIIQYLKQGYTQLEISNVFVKLNIKPNSLSIIEKRLKSIREKFGAKTNFHLAVILFKK